MSERIRNLIRDLFGLWFDFERRGGPAAYAASGFGLMAFKYAVDAAVFWLVGKGETRFAPDDPTA